MEALVAIELPIVILPDNHLKQILNYAKSIPTLLFPEYVRVFILGSLERRAAVQKACSGKPELAAALLEFCLQDIDDNQPVALVGTTAYVENCEERKTIKYK